MFMGSGTQPFSPARLASNATTATNQTQDFPLEFEVRNLSNNCRFWPRPQLSAIVTPHQICALTPLKINMEHNHGSLVQIIFLSKWVMFRFHVNLRNRNCELTKVSRNTKKRMRLKVWQHMRNQVWSCMVLTSQTAVFSLHVNLKGLCEVVPIAFPRSQKRSQGKSTRKNLFWRSNIEATQEQNFWNMDYTENVSSMN